jgi:hypothetical protein
MTKKSSRAKAIEAINQKGILLVFPIENRKDIPSLWSEFYPRAKMRWEWDESHDNRVSSLWHLREELSTSNEVIYTKWFRGRATFISKEVFGALLKLLNPGHQLQQSAQISLSQDARRVLATLEMDSPLSTKVLKRSTDLQGRFNEATYTRATKELWSRLLIVAYGEVDEGAFPSLAIGATRVLFEDLYRHARSMSEEQAFAVLRERTPAQSPFLQFFEKLKKSCVAA